MTKYSNVLSAREKQENRTFLSARNKRKRKSSVERTKVFFGFDKTAFLNIFFLKVHFASTIYISIYRYKRCADDINIYIQTFTE